jgi:hypothetical protein
MAAPASPELVGLRRGEGRYQPCPEPDQLNMFWLLRTDTARETVHTASLPC